jgi:uncharacterized SAM-binding protein YcdF (DUF218 family)
VIIAWLIFLLSAGLLAALALGAWLLYQHENSTPLPATKSSVQVIFSPDGNLRADIHSRSEGTFQVEVCRREQDDLPGMGVIETWRRVYGPAITSSLEEAVEIANQQVGA